MPKPSDLLQGTLDLLILKTLAREPLHGWGVAKRIQALSGDVLAVGQGSLYPALHRLEQQGWIRAEWKDSELGRSAKFYSLTRRRPEATGAGAGQLETAVVGRPPADPERVREPCAISSFSDTASARCFRRKAVEDELNAS